MAHGLESVDHLRDCLTTRALTSIARLRPERLLRGQAASSRQAARSRFPAVRFYGDQPMKGGLLGHKHARLEAALVVSGALYFGIGDRIYRVRAGDWCLCPSQIPHGECCAGAGLNYELLWFLPMEKGLGLHKTVYRRGRGYGVTDAILLRSLPPVIAQGLEELVNSPAADLPRQRARLLRLAAWCVERLEESAGGSAPPAHPQVALARNILEDAVRNPPSVSELARQVRLSPNYLSTRFHRAYGLTIRRFIEERRVGLAAGQLLHSPQTVKEIAYALNFADPQHFSHLFRRITGLSPSAYRGQAVEMRTRRA